MEQYRSNIQKHLPEIGSLFIMFVVLMSSLIGCSNIKNNQTFEESNQELMSPNEQQEDLKEEFLTLEEIKEIIQKADEAVYIAMKKNEKEDKYKTVEELQFFLADYFDEQMMDYIIFMYQFEREGDILSYESYNNSYNFMIDREGDISIIEQNENLYRVKVHFSHRGRRLLTNETGTIELKQDEGGSWKISNIYQWYNDFKYNHMKTYKFSPEYFTEEMAENLIQKFGRNEKGEAVLLDSAMNREGFIFSESSDELLDEADMKELTRFELFLAIQEIYARHGKKFEDVVLYEYFNEKEWYEPYTQIFTEKPLNQTEEENIKRLTQYGNLEAEMVIPEYGSLYDVCKSDKNVITAEEAASIVYFSFEAVSQIMQADNEMLSEELSDDVIKLYQIKYNDSELREYLSSYFSDDIFEYLLVPFQAMYSLWYDEVSQKYYVSREGTPGIDVYMIDYFEDFRIISQDSLTCTLSVPFILQMTSEPVENRGEMVLTRNEYGKWIISAISQEYYDKLFYNESE